MQPDFFNIDVHRNTGDKHKGGSKIAVGVDRLEARHNDSPAPGKSFTDALKDAEGVGDVETASKHSVASEVEGDARQPIVDSLPAERTASQTAEPASGKSLPIVSKKSPWAARAGLGGQEETRRGQALPMGHERPHRGIGRQPFGRRHDSKADLANPVTPTVAAPVHSAPNGPAAANDARPEIGTTASTARLGVDPGPARTALAHAVPNGSRRGSDRHRHFLSSGRARKAPAGPTRQQTAVRGEITADGGQFAKEAADNARHGRSSARNEPSARRLSPEALSAGAAAGHLNIRSRPGNDGRPVTEAQRSGFDDPPMGRTINGTATAGHEKPHRPYVTAEAPAGRTASPTGRKAVRPEIDARHQWPGPAKRAAGSSLPLVEKHGDDPPMRGTRRTTTELNTPRTGAAPAAAAVASGPALGKGLPLPTSPQGAEQQSPSMLGRRARHKPADRRATTARAGAVATPVTVAGRPNSRSLRAVDNTFGKATPTPDGPTPPRLTGEEKNVGTGKRFTVDKGRTRHPAANGGQPQPATAQAADRDSGGPSAFHRSGDAVIDRGSGLSGIPRSDGAAPQPAAPAATAPRTLPAGIMQRITEKAVSMVKNGQDSIKIQMNPASLGHIQLKVATEGQQVMIRMLVENPATRDLLEGNMGLLRAELGQQGLTIDRLDLDLFSGSTTSGQSGNQADKETGSHLSHRHQAARQSDEKPFVEDTAETVSDADHGSTLVGVFA